MGIKVSAGVGMKIWLLPTDTQVVVRSISLSGELYAGVQFMWNFLMEWLKEGERKKASCACVFYYAILSLNSKDIATVNSTNRMSQNASAHSLIRYDIEAVMLVNESHSQRT